MSKTRNNNSLSAYGRVVLYGAFACITIWAAVSMILEISGSPVDYYILIPAVVLLTTAFYSLKNINPFRFLYGFMKKRRADFIAVSWIIICIAGVDVANDIFNLTPERHIYSNGTREKALVIETDDSRMMVNGPLAMGEQRLRVRVLSGKFKNEEIVSTNLLRSQLELDTIYKSGDKILISVLEHPATENDAEMEILSTAQGYYRTDYEIILFALFAILLIAFGGLTGLKAFLTFIFTFSVIWQLLIPLCLKGWNPVIISLLAVCVLCGVIIFAVAGVTRKGMSAFAGAFSGVLASCIMAIVFTDLLQVNGNVQSRSQALFFAGYDYLDMTKLFIGAVFLASSGAVMDLAVDVSAGMHELVIHKPDITRRQLLASGLRIGRAVVGTMTTTLLLAYAGGFLTLMMSFAAEGVPFIDIMNYPYVVPEILKTVVGSIGLVLVAPLTAVMGCLILPEKTLKK